MKAIIKFKNSVILQEKPVPDLLDNKSVLIKITLAGLCRTDLYVAQNKIPVRDGMILGHEFTGTIEKKGSDVSEFQINQRVGVMPIFNHGSHFFMLGIDFDGAYADYITIPASHIYQVPDHFSNEEAAFLEPIAACLAVTKAPIHPNHRGLIYGNNRIAELTRRILYAKGFKSVDVCAEDQLIEMSNAYDFIIETTPTASAFEDIIRLIKPKGIILLKSRPFTSILLPMTAIVRKEITLIGVHYGDFQEGIDLLASGRLTVNDLLGSTYSFEEAVEILSGKKTVSENNKIFFKS